MRRPGRAGGKALRSALGKRLGRRFFTRFRNRAPRPFERPCDRRRPARRQLPAGRWLGDGWSTGPALAPFVKSCDWALNPARYRRCRTSPDADPTFRRPGRVRSTRRAVSWSVSAPRGQIRPARGYRDDQMDPDRSSVCSGHRGICARPRWHGHGQQLRVRHFEPLVSGRHPATSAKKTGPWRNGAISAGSTSSPRPDFAALIVFVTADADGFTGDFGTEPVPCSSASQSTTAPRRPGRPCGPDA